VVRLKSGWTATDSMGQNGSAIARLGEAIVAHVCLRGGEVATARVAAA
jgi:hypothetical protein